jgi:hypothetical protein
MAEILTPVEYEAHPLSNVARLFPTAAAKKFKPSSMLLGEVGRLEATVEALARFAKAADAHWKDTNKATEDAMIAARGPLRDAGWLG